VERREFILFELTSKKITKTYGNKKETVYKTSVQGLQENKLLYSQIETEQRRAEVGIQEILQMVQKEYLA